VTEPRTESSPGSSPALGVVFLAIAAGLWSLNGVLIKSIFADANGPSGVSIAFYRSLFAGLCLFPLARGKWATIGSSGRREPGGTPPTRGGATFKSARAEARSSRLPRPAAVGCMVLFTLMTVTFVLAMTKTETANVLILQYTSTFWIFALSPWLLRETPRREEVRLLAIAVPGIAIIFAGNAKADMSGLSIALASGVGFGLLTMLLRHLRDSNPVVVTVFNNLGSALLLLPFCIGVGGLAVSQRSLVLLIVMGVVQFGLPYYLYSLALGRVPASTAGLVTLLEPVLAPLWTFLVLGEKVPVATMLGGSLILLALGLFARNARARRSALEVVT